MKRIQALTFWQFSSLSGETEEAEICCDEKDDKFKGSKNVSNGMTVHSSHKIAYVAMWEIVQ